jgi:UDP-glucose 4-epimerase
MHRKVLVTGAAGFIGQNLVTRLLQNGFEVHATSRSVRQDGSGKVRWWQAELASADETRKLFAEVRPDIVFHLSGRTGAAPDMDLVLPLYHSLATSTVNVLVNATALDCKRIITFASCNEPDKDDPDCIPASPYAAGKWVGTVYARMFHKLYNAPVVTLKPFMVYGPGQAREKLVPSVAASLVQNRQPLLTSCKTRGDWIYIDDVVDACMAAIDTPAIEGQEFDIGTGTLESQRRVVETLVEISGRNITPAFGALPDRPHEHEVAANIARPMEKLGWKAQTSLKDGLLKTWAWYRKALASAA